MSLTIVCMKWGTKYDPSYVNKLYSMVERNLSSSFRFVCFTDDPTGIKECVETYELPPIAIPSGSPERGWRKLTVLGKTKAKLEGRCLFLDLDVIIVGNLDEICATKSSFSLAFDEKKKKSKIGNSSVFVFDAMTHSSVLDNFNQNAEKIIKNYRNEQAYLSALMDKKGVLSFFPTEWCPSFKYHCVPQFPLNFLFSPKIPVNSKIILFHGNPEPLDAIHGRSKSWYRFIKKTPWIAKFWIE